jgi:hypothetical protein
MQPDTFYHIYNRANGSENLFGLISQQFSNFFNSYAKAYNKLYERNGSLFNRPFKAKPVTSDSYLTNIISYIHHNPVHHGFTKHIGDWPHCGFHILISDKPTFLQRQEVIDWFGDKEELIRFHQQAEPALKLLEAKFT